MRKRLAIVLAAATLSIGVAEAQRPTPYWASISAGRAMMRTGPGQNYPATWLYIRPDLPIKVVGVTGDWRRVEDPDGTVGWMLVRLLSDQRSGIVRGEGGQAMHESASETARVRYRADPGVVGRLSNCRNGWCLFDVAGKRGYIRTTSLWGMDEAETIN